MHFKCKLQQAKWQSFIKAVTRNEEIFNCYYLHSCHLIIIPYFKMVRNVKAAKKPGLAQILLSAMAVALCVQLPKRISIRRRIKWAAEVLVGWKVAAKEKWGLPGNLIQQCFSQTVTEGPCLLHPGKLGLGLREWKRETMQLTWSEDGKGTTECKWGRSKDLDRRSISTGFVTLSLAQQKYKG